MRDGEPVACVREKQDPLPAICSDSRQLAASPRCFPSLLWHVAPIPCSVEAKKFRSMHRSSWDRHSVLNVQPSRAELPTKHSYSGHAYRTSFCKPDGARAELQTSLRDIWQLASWRDVVGGCAGEVRPPFPSPTILTAPVRGIVGPLRHANEHVPNPQLDHLSKHTFRLDCVWLHLPKCRAGGRVCRV